MFGTGPAARIPAESPKSVDRASGPGRRQEPRQTEFELQGQHALTCQQREGVLETLTDNLIERVDTLIQASKAPREWGSPLLSTTPTSFAVRELAMQVEALENAVREIASEVQKLSAQG
jgi:hypothetical protein